MSGLLLLALLLAGIGFWLDSRRAHEFAVGVCRHVCDTEQVVLLDQTVALAGLGVRRAASGWLQFVRTYSFEFSNDVSERHPGSVVLHGSTPVSLTIYGREMTLVEPD